MTIIITNIQVALLINDFTLLITVNKNIYVMSHFLMLEESHNK